MLGDKDGRQMAVDEKWLLVMHLSNAATSTKSKHVFNLKG